MTKAYLSSYHTWAYWTNTWHRLYVRTKCPKIIS